MNNSKVLVPGILLMLLLFPSFCTAEPIIVDHNAVMEFDQIPDYWLDRAKEMTIHYAHRSHGSQPISGLQYLENLDPVKYSFAVREATTEGLPAPENPPELRMYSGNPPETYISSDDYWNNDVARGGAADALERTMTVVDTGDYDVSAWTWCNEMPYTGEISAEEFDLYLSNLDWLESQYPDMRFIYMTGHTYGTANSAPTLSSRNQMLRDYCNENDKVLYDFFDIESHDPDGNYYPDAVENCDWCVDWCASHPQDCVGLDAIGCSHSSSEDARKFNCVVKGKAFWWMMARLAGWPGVSSGFDYVTWEPGTNPPDTAQGDCSIHDIPVLDFPEKWEAYDDPVFNTPVRRFTDNANEANNQYMNIQYTTFSNTNSDNTIVALGAGNHQNLFYDAVTGEFLEYAVDFYWQQYSYAGDDEFRWSQDPGKPDIGYFRDKKYFCEYNFSKPPGERVSLIRDFGAVYSSADQSAIHNNDKGEQSWVTPEGDYDRYWAFIVTNSSYNYGATHIICYDMLQGRVYEADLSELYEERGWDRTPAVRWVTMSPSGRYVIAKLYTTASPQGTTTTLLERDEVSGKLVFVNDGGVYRDILNGYDTGHPAWGYDMDGNEIFTYCNALPNFVMADLETGTRTTLFDGGAASSDCPDCCCTYDACPGPEGGTHVSSCYNRDTDGWFFYTNYANSGTSTSFWLERELWAVRFSSDPSAVKVWRIASTRINPGSYSDQARAQVSQDGRYVYFDSNWLGTQEREIFRAELPDNWWDDLSEPATPEFEYYLVDGPGQFEATSLQTYPGHYESYADPAYGTTIRRITDESDNVRPNYIAKQQSIENADGTLLLVDSRARGGSVGDIFSTSDGEFRLSILHLEDATDNYCWSNTEPDVLYVFDGSISITPDLMGEFYKVTIDPDTWTATYDMIGTVSGDDFLAGPPPAGETLAGIMVHDEGPTSWDCRYWPIIIDYTNHGYLSENTAYFLGLFDRDLNGFENPGVKGFMEIPGEAVYGAGVSPGGNYIHWRSWENTPACTSGTCVRFFPTESFTNSVDWSESTLLGESRMGYHYCLAYDDLGNEVYITTRSVWESGGYNSYITYWIYINPGDANAVDAAEGYHWKINGSTSLPGFGDSHVGTVGVIPGAREWVAILPTDGDAGDECGNEEYGASTITFAKLSATDKKVWRVAHARHEADGYGEELFSGASRDGNNFYYHSDWCDEQTPMQLFRAELPDNWWDDLSAPLDTCSSLGHHCCDACEAGTEQTQYDGDCPGQVCCGSCADSQSHRADISEPFGCIDMLELTAFINLWFSGSGGVTMPELMQGISLWKAGTGC